MGYAAWSREIFFSALSLPFAAPGRELGGEAMRKRRNACGKLNLIPLFSNKLSSERFSFGQLQSKISSLQRNGNVDHFFGPDPRRLERRGGSVGAAIAPARPTSASYAGGPFDRSVDLFFGRRREQPVERGRSLLHVSQRKQRGGSPAMIRLPVIEL
jgi:hypothetical protein